MRCSSRQRVNIRDCERIHRRLLAQRLHYATCLKDKISQLYGISYEFKSQSVRRVTTAAHFDHDVALYRRLTRRITQNMANEAQQLHTSTRNLLQAWGNARLGNTGILSLLRRASYGYRRELRLVMSIAAELLEITDDDELHGIETTPSSRSDDWSEEDALYGYAEDVENILWGLSDHVDTMLGRSPNWEVLLRNY